MHTTHLSPSGARRRLDASLVGQLNLEWARLRADSGAAQAVRGWAERKTPLAGCATLADVELRTAAAGRAAADEILLALLELAAAGEQLAGRTVLQLMLGKAVRIAASHAGRADRDTLEQVAVAALWDVVATYPISRRRQKVAANLAMDTLRHVVAELGHDRHESPVEPETMTNQLPEVAEAGGTVADLELYEVLAAGVDAGIISRADAALLIRIYCAGPADPSGPAVAAELGLTWAAARQRCSRAVRKLAAAVHADLAAA